MKGYDAIEKVGIMGEGEAIPVSSSLRIGKRQSDRFV